LAIGQGANRLYVADKVKRCIWAVRLNQGPPNPTLFWSSNSLREPLGLAVDSNGTVWIGDKLANAVFGVDANGYEVKILR
jgi:sugar lactone lactonase YvrE